LALTGLDDRPVINFLHSRLAPPKIHRMPRWTILAAAALLILIAGVFYALRELEQQQSGLEAMQSRLDGMSGEIKAADSFVAMVNFAQHWHGGQSRYLLCLRDLTLAVPEDGQTYATNLILRDPAASPSAARPAGPNAKPIDTTLLSGQFFGKTMDQQAVQTLIDRLKHSAGFTDVKLGGTQNAARNGEVAFSITFTYRAIAPSKSLPAKSASGKTTQPARQP
jgi:Tfp pilus assembly protein PilN